MSHKIQPHFDRMRKMDFFLVPSIQDFIVNGPPFRSYRQFVEEFAARINVNVLMAGMLPRHMVVHAQNSLYFQASFRRSGSRTFRISEGLATRLRHTNVESIPCEWVRLPFPTLYLQYPDNPTIFTISGKDMAGQPYQYKGIGAYCTETTEEAGRMLRVYKVGIHETDPLDDQTYHFSILLKDGASLREQFDAVKTEERFLEPGTDVAQFRREVWEGVSLIVNTLLYINDPAAELSAPQKGTATLKLEQHPKKGDEWKRRMRRIAVTEPIVIDVGASVPTSPEFSDVGPSRELSVRYVVRGHWRQQPCGPNNSQRKLTWISPYWKGPEWADVVTRDYVVMDSTIDKERK